ncbi:MAG: hypothetical protein M1816_007942 [Peltula sp. TS41687]|nr:MAG: hypothetical protein M1816_007942 [Peltula sp. TS41687]
MPRILQPLLLPQLVEARRSQELKDADMDFLDRTSSFPTRNSSVSELSLPATPTFSLRGHSRYASSISSVDAASPTLKGNAPGSSSPENLEDSYVGKRSLPDVKEESLERDEEYDMLDDRDQLEIHHHLERCTTVLTRRSVVSASTFDNEFKYDLADGFVSENESPCEPMVKRRRAGDSALASVATRLGTRFPSFARRWKGRKISTGLVLNEVGAVEPVRTKSSRASSLTSSIGKSYSGRDAAAAAATSPVDVTFEVHEESPCPVIVDPEPTEVSKQVAINDERHPTTPLLPPLMIPDSPNPLRGSPLQSPLQSPTVAESPEASCTLTTPVENKGPAPVIGLPSPPLSTRPSLSSLQRHRAGSLVPANEIPGIQLAEPEDVWSSRLGHANFDIHPEPYMPEAFDAESYEQIRANWERARCNYLKHLARIGEHWGITSKTYRLTTEKWAEIDARWKTNHDRTLAVAGEQGALNLSFRQRHAEPPMVVMKLPSLSDPHSHGKFPKLGDGDIVGPMIKATKPPLSKPPRRSRRATVFQFLHDVGLSSSLWLGRGSAKERVR